MVFFVTDKINHKQSVLCNWQGLTQWEMRKMKQVTQRGVPARDSIDVLKWQYDKGD